MFAQESSSTDDILTTCLAAIDAGWATTGQLRQAAAWRRKARPQLGNLAMTQGKLTVSQVFDILGQQASVGGLFGQIALQLGLLNKNELDELLELQASLTPAMADVLVSLGIISSQQRTIILSQIALEGSSHFDEAVPA
jgi:hypothetical protein